MMPVVSMPIFAPGGYTQVMNMFAPVDYNYWLIIITHNVIFCTWSHTHKAMHIVYNNYAHFGTCVQFWFYVMYSASFYYYHINFIITLILLLSLLVLNDASYHFYAGGQTRKGLTYTMQVANMVTQLCNSTSFSAHSNAVNPVSHFPVAIRQICNFHCQQGVKWKQKIYPC